MRILCLSTHPDDETLGCGGTLLKHAALGHEVACLFLTDGNREQALTIPLLEKMYGFAKVVRLGLAENTLDDLSLNDIIPPLADTLRQWQPEVVYVPNRSDVHSDHRRAFQGAQACLKAFRAPFVKKIMMMEAMSETDFVPPLHENLFIPNVFSDVTDVFEKKMKIIEVFSSELLPSPLTRSEDAIRAFHRYRGSQANVLYAETFMLIREAW